MGFDFIVILLLRPSHCGFSFVFGCGVSFSVSSSVFLLMIVQLLVVIPVLSQEGVSPFPSFCDVIIHITFINVINPALDCITFYNFMYFEEAERRKQSKYKFIALVIVTSLFIISGCFLLSLCIQVTIWSNFLSPIQLYSYLLCAVTGKYVTFLYVISSVVQCIHIILYNGFLNQWREERRRNLHLCCLL